MLHRTPLHVALVFMPLAYGASAQPTIKKDLLPAQGNVFGYHDVPYVRPGKAGNDLKWDFSGLTSGGIVPYHWGNTSVAPGAGAFPTSASVLQIPGEPTSYYQMGDTALFWLGTWSDSGLVRFDPPLAVMDLPCGMNTIWSDSGIAAVTGTGRIDVRMTHIDGRADAWGTLVMPYGEIEDVLRIRTELRVTALDRPDRIHLHEVRYSWYCDRTPMPLLVVVERSGWPPPRQFMRWLDGSWRDNPNRLFQPVVLHPFPDPTEDVITLDLPAREADRTIVQLIDGGGQVRRQWLAEFTREETRRMTLDLSGVPSGLYTLTWTGTNGTIGNGRIEKR